MIGHYKKDTQKYKENEYKYIAVSSVFSAFVASVLTNCLEVVTIAKQAKPDINVWSSIIQQEGPRLLTKGIGP